MYKDSTDPRGFNYYGGIRIYEWHIFMPTARAEHCRHWNGWSGHESRFTGRETIELEQFRWAKAKSCIHRSVRSVLAQAHVSTGQNPTGTSMFLERRKELYAVFQKHDILIIEDEPYCSLSK